MAFLPAIAAVASVAGGVLTGIGKAQEAKAAAAASDYNARAADMAAAAERDAAAAEAQDRRRKLSGERATSIARRGASGVALAGTPLLIDEDILGEIELDIARIGQKGEAKATQLENEGTLERMKAKNYRRAGPLAAGASILGGISSVRF